MSIINNNANDANNDTYVERGRCCRQYLGSDNACEHPSEYHRRRPCG